MTIHFIHRKSFLFVLIMVMSVVFACSGGSDSEKVTKALANRLSTVLQIDGAQLKTGTPPTENPGDSAFPQVKELKTEPTLEIGSSFSVTIVGETDAPESVAGAIVAVDLAESYFEVSQEYDAKNNQMVLTGTLAFDYEIPGKTYSIRFALLNEDGEVGNYLTWDAEIPKVDDEICEDLCKYNIDCGFFEKEVMDECLTSCQMDMAETSHYYGEECLPALQSTVTCAMKLECDQYILVFSEESSEYCQDENQAVDELCPDYAWPSSFERSGESSSIDDSRDDSSEEASTDNTARTETK